MTQEIFRVKVKANFRSRIEAKAFIADVKSYLDPKVKAELAFGCDVECDASERYRKDIKVAEVLPIK